MTDEIFDKTDKGREEIRSRKFGLASRLRPLLVMLDGKKNSGEILEKVAGLGLSKESIIALLDEGFIQPLSPPVQPSTDIIPAEETRPADMTADEQKQFERIYRFYTKTIKSTIGLRGYALQLKVEKATTIDDFHALRQPYVDAVLKARGKEVARTLEMRLGELLYGECPPTDFATIRKAHTAE